ncbi:hypothetical protein F383_22659 [Gossypium arboreum]|jgi:hypothetical protein
MSSD